MTKQSYIPDILLNLDIRWKVRNSIALANMPVICHSTIQKL